MGSSFSRPKIRESLPGILRAPGGSALRLVDSNGSNSLEEEESLRQPPVLKPGYTIQHILATGSTVSLAEPSPSTPRSPGQSILHQHSYFNRCNPWQTNASSTPGSSTTRNIPSGDPTISIRDFRSSTQDTLVGTPRSAYGSTLHLNLNLNQFDFPQEKTPPQSKESLARYSIRHVQTTDSAEPARESKRPLIRPSLVNLGRRRDSSLYKLYEEAKY
ncbi:hypothetical protein G7Y89_g13650 [Cudoniella acicularis]|uniref:Uncharacterized protein n=1 Tax=Cudoniella acicularis TaxID=354080 RepID=A0A8H4VW82_9HELO|nr:hypothetical protein G7Y89_g13650 [Cudoniella acicularis]